MNRLSVRVVATFGAVTFAAALTLGGAGAAVAAPSSGSMDSMQDLKGAWLTPLTGFREGDPISWMHRLTVRKVNGSAAVAWEEWLDCAVQAADCRAAKAGKMTGVDWSAPSRVLLAMDPKGDVHGIGATGSIMLTPREDGMSMVALSSGQRDDGAATPNPTTSGQPPIARRGTSNTGTTPVFGPIYSVQYAATGPTVGADGQYTYTPS